MNNKNIRWNHFASLNSTNEWLLEHPLPFAAQGKYKAQFEDVAVCSADYQTAGRGRLGRKWHAPKKSGVMLSVGAWLPKSALVLANQSDPLPVAKDCVVSSKVRTAEDGVGDFLRREHRWSSLAANSRVVPFSQRAALIAALAVESCLPNIGNNPPLNVQLKWPNDLWLGCELDYGQGQLLDGEANADHAIELGGKLGGVLVESKVAAYKFNNAGEVPSDSQQTNHAKAIDVDSQTHMWVVVGVGVNVSWPAGIKDHSQNFVSTELSDTKVGYAASSLSTLGYDIELEAVVETLSEWLVTFMRKSAQGFGNEALEHSLSRVAQLPIVNGLSQCDSVLLREWYARDILMGREVCIQPLVKVHGDDSLLCTVEGVNRQGMLVVSMNGCEKLLDSTQYSVRLYDGGREK